MASISPPQTLTMLRAVFPNSTRWKPTKRLRGRHLLESMNSLHPAIAECQPIRYINYHHRTYCAPSHPQQNATEQAAQALCELPPSPYTTAYHAALLSGALNRDDAQCDASKVLARVSADVSAYLSNPSAHESTSHRNIGTITTSWFKRISSSSSIFRPSTHSSSSDTQWNQSHVSHFPRGAYLWGGVGSGKTMLVDMMYNTLEHPTLKRRDHFHSFFLDVHSRLHEHRHLGNAAHKLSQVAMDLSSEFRLLVIDEFQVTDISEAVIIHQLFKNLFLNGIVIVATSNRSPSDLYKNGIQRELFLPVIPILSERCQVHEMKSTTDYRLRYSYDSKSTTYFLSSDTSIDFIQDKFNNMRSGFPVIQHHLNVLGRSLVLDHAVPQKQILLISYHDLFEKPLSPADYYAICNAYHTCFIYGLPNLDVIQDRNAVRRLTNFIDTAYEARVKLVIHAQSQPSELIRGIAATPEDAVTEEAFAASRTVSRLIEMQSPQYLDEPWLGPTTS